MKLEKCKRN